MLVAACASTPGARAQTPPAARALRKDSPRKPSPAAEDSDAAYRLRRDTAVALLVELAADARGYKDRGLSARVRALAADALWKADEEMARSLFREAWEASDSAEVRAEVLRAAARYDHALGEEFLEKLVEAERGGEEDGGEPARARPDPTLPPAAVAQRLRLARLLLDSGDATAAVEFAGPALARVTMPGVIFLSGLRAKNREAADQLYEALLRRTALDPSAG
jgi:hypothetical protein